jgi:hypothetical protein
MARKPGNDFPDFDAQTAASQGNAILGIRDSGKSYTAIAIAERFFEAGIPFCAFDPIGRWRFLRVPGHGRGYPVVVAGGAAGDLPLTVESAPKIVRAAMEGGVSLVLDLYDMEVSKADWKRIVGDSIRVLLYENGSHGLRHIFIEEAAEFAPQRIAPDQGRVYAEVEKLARMGGNARLGYTLINQRAEEVNKAVLELCDNLFLHRQKGRNSLNALTKWLNLADVKPGSKEIIQSLPMLPQGECWAWMGGTDRPVHMKVPEKNSFEPDRRAMRGDVAAITKKAVDVASFVADLKSRLAGKAVAVASPPAALVKTPLKQPMEKDVKESEARALRSSNEELHRQNEEMRRELAQLKAGNRPQSSADNAGVALDIEAIISEVTVRLSRDPTLIRLTQTVPEIDVNRTRQVVKMDESTQPGLIAALIADGFFEDGVSVATLGSELRRRGRSVHPANVSRDLNRLAEQGFLTKEENGYRAVAGMKINIVER